ncbi:MAG: tetratricopeptide repeat protein [Verrucomicrobia bacterium]|nr:tetratricopeptide repeat protein [Verrucomicrobiota bacterium]
MIRTGHLLGLAALGWMFIASGCGKKSPSDPASNAGVDRSVAQNVPVPTSVDPEEKYKVAYVRSAQAFSRNDLDGAIKYLDEADQAKPNQANNANLRGAIYTRQRNWAKAEEAFRESLRLQPDLPMAQFNLGEVLFLNNKYAEAKERFQIFLNSQPSNDLGSYKIYLCDLLGGNQAKANEFLARLQPSPNSPLYYFSKAAEAFYRQDKDAGMEYVSSAYRIYPPDANATFADSLVEKGYLSGEQAQKIPEEDKKVKTDELKTLLPEVKK